MQREVKKMLNTDAKRNYWRYDSAIDWINPSKCKCRPEFYEFNSIVQQNTNRFNTGKLLSMIHFHMLNNTFHITLEIILYIVLLHK